MSLDKLIKEVMKYMSRRGMLDDLKKKYGGKAKDPPPKSRRKNAN